MNLNFNLSQINDAAAKLWKQYHQQKIWAFYGEMGAGKTTLISALCKVLQVHETVSSPTFAIINEYSSDVAGVIYHMDWYRLKNEAEIINAGCEDCLLSGNICFIEWAEKAPYILPYNSLQLNLAVISDFERALKVNYLNS